LDQLFQELNRRNVFRVAIAYLAVGWLVLQVADIVFDNIAAPAWLMQALMFFLAIGFPFAILFAWAFELTPEGLKREKEVERDRSITRHTGRKLDFVIIAVLAIAVSFLLADRFLLRETAVGSAVTEKSVAVLPFVAMSDGDNDEYFADGLTEEILNSLTRIPELLVTARTSAFHFKGKDIPVPEIANTLGVAHVVEGSVRRDGERLRVTAQLIRASDGFHLWSENYDRSSEDTFGVQTDIAQKIATALDIVLDDEQLQRMHAVELHNPEAYVAFQQGLEAYVEAHDRVGGASDNLRKANRLFDRVLALEPNSFRTYVLHSDYYAHYLIDTIGDAAVSDTDRAAALQQLNADFDNAVRVAPDETSRNVAAFDQALLSGRWRSLPAIFDKVIEGPGCAVPGWWDQVTVAYGLADRVLPLMRRQIECDPLNYAGWWDASIAQIWLGRPDEAIETATAGYEKSGHGSILTELVMAHIAAGQLETAARLVEQDVLTEEVLLRNRLALAAARGDEDQTARMLAEFIESQPDRLAVRLGLLARAGRLDEANALAATLDAERYGYLILMQPPVSCYCGAPWDISVTPNFARLLDQAGLPWPPASPIHWPLKDY